MNIDQTAEPSEVEFKIAEHFPIKPPTEFEQHMQRIREQKMQDLAARIDEEKARNALKQAFPTQARKEYVLGFCFMHDNTEVVLIRKNKPEWQAGLLNGIGGKIEPGETIHEAMVREFREETGVLVPNWDLFVIMDFQGAVVYCFKCSVSSILPVSCTDELVGVYHIIDAMGSQKKIPNLNWLIPMALYDSQTHEPHWKGAPILKYP